MVTTRRNVLTGALLAIPFARLLRSPDHKTEVNNRIEVALKLRQKRALAQSGPMPVSLANGDEANIPNYVSCFAKGLPQNRFAEVDPSAYKCLLTAIGSGKHPNFEQIPKG